MEDARILIVDDQPDFRAMLTVILQRSGFQVFVAADGEEALHLVSEIAPDLILMDVSMPGMDGIEAAHRIRQLTSAPILFLSALGGPETVARGRAVGGTGHLTKPFRTAELILRIQKELSASGIRATQINGIR
jgi:DNA-binding response OmpR family regulator